MKLHRALSQIFLFCLSLNFLGTSNLWGRETTGQEISEEELYRLEKMANDMLAQLSPEEREQAMAMAQQMEQEIAQLPPEKLAEVEAALKQDMQYLLSEDSPYKQFGAEPVPPVSQPEYQAPIDQDTPEPSELDSNKDSEAQKPKKKSIDPVKLQTSKLLIQNVIRNFDEILLRAQALPRVSSDRAHEKSWQDLQPEIMQLKSALAIIAEKPVLIEQILETKFSNLYSSLQTLGKELTEGTRKLQILKSLDTIIDQLVKLELSQLRTESQKLIKEFVPEALSEFTPVGAKWYQADYSQAQQKFKTAKSNKTALAPHKLAEQLEQELINLQSLIQETKLIVQLEKFDKTKNSKNSSPDKTKDNSSNSSSSKSERTTQRQLEADLIRVNLQYERLLRALISVVGKSYQLAPQLIQLLHTKVSNADSEINQIKRLISSALTAEFELVDQVKKQMLKLAAQANELHDKIATLKPTPIAPATPITTTGTSAPSSKPKDKDSLYNSKERKSNPPAISHQNNQAEHKHSSSSSSSKKSATKKSH